MADGEALRGEVGISVKTFFALVASVISATGLIITIGVHVIVRDRDVESRLSKIEGSRFTQAQGEGLKNLVTSLEVQVERRMTRIEAVLERIEDKVGK